METLAAFGFLTLAYGNLNYERDRRSAVSSSGSRSVGVVLIAGLVT